MIYSKFILDAKIFLYYIPYKVNIIYYKYSCEKNTINSDINRWTGHYHIPYNNNTFRFVFLLRFCPQFRNLFYYRIRELFMPNIFKLLCPPDPNVFIANQNNIAAGLFLEHAFGTRIRAKSIGANCTFRQLSVVGVKSPDRFDEQPVIGDNVDFGACVICVGKVHIGDNAIIGAGSVVVKDVPANAIVAGNPARVIRFRDDNTINRAVS